MKVRAVARASLLYLGVGALMAVIFYFITDRSQFAPLHIRQGNGGWEVQASMWAVPDVLVAYAVYRAPLALLYGTAMTWMTGRARAAWWLILVGMLIPLVFEVATAVPYANMWVGVFVSRLLPDSEWARPILWQEFQLRQAVASLVPGSVAGMLVAMWLVRKGRNRAQANAITGAP